jgi:CheY-like chemotaxis protein
MKHTILIIDDDTRNIFALSAVLRSRGYSVLSATGMHEAFSILKTHDGIGIILMDMMMPEMDGYEAIQTLRNDNDHQHVPVIAVTAQAMAGDRERCLQAGANDYISKPVDIDQLNKILSEYLK